MNLSPSNDVPSNNVPGMLRFSVASFDQWRAIARKLVQQAIPPERILWQDGFSTTRNTTASMFEDAQEHLDVLSQDATAESTSVLVVPRSFIELAKQVSHHRDPIRFELLYRVLWRLTHGEPQLLNVASDQDLHQLHRMQRSIARDIHKMHAFVRFRKVGDPDGERFIAWHRPGHYIVRLATPFFARRFDVMRWAILTPDESASWDGVELRFGPGVARQEAPTGDDLETLWKVYYSNIFNPARLKLKAMKTEMPVRHWATLPEAEVIDSLIRNAPQRVEEMVKRASGPMGAQSFIPSEAHTIEALEAAAEACRGCELYRDATQTVFGAGPANAKLVMVGEQPGDQEDRAGKPFVGPAGMLLDKVLEEVALDRSKVYVTNAVKHFKFQQTASRRLHVKPSAREVTACQPWLQRELSVIQPAMLVCLGATAANAIFGPQFRITQSRGVVQSVGQIPWVLATYHPSALLRVPDPDKRATMHEQFVADLKLAAEHLKSLDQ